jgi:hypothetical protein
MELPILLMAPSHIGPHRHEKTLRIFQSLGGLDGKLNPLNPTLKWYAADLLRATVSDYPKFCGQRHAS